MPQPQIMQQPHIKNFGALDLLLIGGLLGLLFVYAQADGPMTRHMILHIALMTTAAPLLAKFWHCRIKSNVTNGWPALWGATALQAIVFFVWHSPPAMMWAMGSLFTSLLMQSSLLVVAVMFWLTVFRLPVGAIWQSVLALLVTGKLFCLLAILLVLSPRVIYMHGGHSMLTLADQQFAGLLMVVICPMSYILMAVVLISRWFYALSVNTEQVFNAS